MPLIREVMTDHQKHGGGSREIETSDVTGDRLHDRGEIGASMPP